MVPHEVRKGAKPNEEAVQPNTLPRDPARCARCACGSLLYM